MDDFFLKKKKKKLIGLQLAPLIDIFVLIIIFLIKGTVMSGASITLPEQLKPAKSKSPEGIEPAGQIYLTQTEIVFAMIDERMSTSDFLNQLQLNSEDKNLKINSVSNRLKEYLFKIPDEDKKSGILLNFLADAAVDYKTTFEVSKYFRNIGFQNILYVAEGEK